MCQPAGVRGGLIPGSILMCPGETWLRTVNTTQEYRSGKTAPWIESCRPAVTQTMSQQVCQEGTPGTGSTGVRPRTTPNSRPGNKPPVGPDSPGTGEHILESAPQAPIPPSCPGSILWGSDHSQMVCKLERGVHRGPLFLLLLSLPSTSTLLNSLGH